MAILGLGTDIIEISRVEKAVSRSGNKLAKRLLSNNEWITWNTYHRKVHFLANHFVVKEAAAKAFGTGIRNGLAFNQFEVFNDKLGKPCLRFWNVAQDLADSLGVNHVHVTISDTQHYTCATVIIES